MGTAVPLCLESLPSTPRNTWRGTVPPHLTKTQIAYIRAAEPGEWALDHGCGHGLQRPVLEGLGYRVCGMDYAGNAMDHRADAHALPYRGSVFALVLSIAVLEHLRRPARAISEVYRVLRPGGSFIGTVAFGEPFHDDSYFHMSHIGLAELLGEANFRLECVMPIPGWSAVRAQLTMGLGSRVPGWISLLASLPASTLLALHGLFARRPRVDSVARHAGAFFFVAHKAS